MGKKQQRTKNDLERLRSLAEDMFINIGKTGREIAETLGVSEQSVSTWRKGREGERSWDERKRDIQLTPVKLKELLLNEARKIVDNEKSTVNADQLSKIMSAIDKLDKSVNPRVVMTVFQMFDNYMAEIDPNMALTFTEYHKRFLQHLIALES